MARGEMNAARAGRYALATLLVAACISGCASAREGYLYDSKVPRKGSLVFEEALAKRGQVKAVLADGEHCAGTFNTVPAIVQVDEETGQIAREESQTGLAILQCSAQHVVRCGFQRDHAGAGYGHCTDTNGRNYDLYF
jgi:hypothetical protein